jgi:hypothetical protein
MSFIWTPEGRYRRVDFEDEADLEKSIINVAKDLFGAGRIYLDIKKKIGTAKQNIPDAYLLDLSSPKPRLYVVENELSGHHPTKHIAVQLVEFMSAFYDDKNGVRNILVKALNADPNAKKTCESYVASQKLHSTEDLIHKLVFEADFAALVIIDEQSERLEMILNKGFGFKVEVIELARYESDKGVQIYAFEPFLAGLISEVPVAEGKELGKQMDLADVDTVVVPARPGGFNKVFLGENRWYAVRIHASMKPQIKYIAAYQIRPISAITHIAPIQSIEQWSDTDKVVLNFSEPAKAIGPIKLLKDGKVRALQGLRYTNHQKVESAKSLDEAF